MMYKHFWYMFEPRPPFRVVSVSSPFTLPTQLGSAPSIQFATGLSVHPHMHEIIVSYGELDCYATLARFPLGGTIKKTQARFYSLVGALCWRGCPHFYASLQARGHFTLAEPLLSIIMLLHAAASGDSVDVFGGPTDISWVMESTFEVTRLFANASFAGADGPGSCSHKVTVMLTEHCMFLDREGAALDSLSVRRGCMTCTWEAVRSRLPSESDGDWAARLYREGVRGATVDRQKS